MKPFHIWLSLFWIAISANAAANEIDCSASSHELANMVKDDQEYREELGTVLAKSDPSAPSPELIAVVEKVGKLDTANTEKLKEILNACSWPTEAEASHDAWLLTQHADKDLAFQKKALPQLKLAIEKGSASAKDYAYLADRVAIAEGKQQLYGTQFDQPAPCTLVMKPVDSLEAVELRRHELRMETLKEYEASERQMLVRQGCQSAVIR